MRAVVQPAFVSLISHRRIDIQLKILLVARSIYMSHHVCHMHETEISMHACMFNLESLTSPCSVHVLVAIEREELEPKESKYTIRR